VIGLKCVNQCGKNRNAHKCSDKEVSAPSSASEGVTVKTVHKSVKFRLKKSKDNTKQDDSDERDSSESESVTIKRKSKRTPKEMVVS